MSLYFLQVCFEKIYYKFAEEPDELFWARLIEKTYAFVGNCLEHLESREILSVHRPKILIVSVVPRYKTLRDFIRSLYNNLFDRLFMPTSQSIIDRRETMFRLDTNHLALIRVPIVH